MTNFLKKPIGIISVLVIISLLVGGYFYFVRGEKGAFEIATAKRSDLVQEISITGRVKPAESVELAFERGGKVSAVYADVGKQVPAGQTLVVLENFDLAAQRLQAEAGVESAQAKLTELKKGTRPEEIEVQETKVANAKTALDDATENLADKLQDAYTKADDAIRNKVDQLFSNPKSQNPNLIFIISDSQLKEKLEWDRMLVELTLKVWEKDIDTLTTLNDPLSHLASTKKNLVQTKLFLDDVALAVNVLTPNSSLSQTTIDAWKSNIFTVRTNINTTIANITSAEEKLKTAKSVLALEEKNLTLKKAGVIEEQIMAQEAQVKQSMANLQNYNAQIAKTIIHAPISGTVTKQDAKVGEIVPANTSIISLISASQFEIEADVPEADISKIKLDNMAKVTLDAYGNDIKFSVKVVAIDPAETIIDGVATYKTKFQFTEKDERVKSGMTANIDVLTEKLENVIVVPQRAVITRNGDKIVRILNSEIPKEVKVKTGLRGSDGNIEIIDGVKEGDRVVISFE